MRPFRIFWVFFRLSVMNELEYRANFFVQIFQSLWGLASALAGLAIVFSHTKTLGGWSPAELLVVLGVFTVVGGVINLIIQPSMQKFMDDVRQGTLDFTLIKPEDSQLLVSIRQVQVWKLVDIAMGLALVGFGMVQLGEVLGLFSTVAFVVSLVCGFAIVYSFWVFLATLSFWFVRLENILMIFQGMYQAGRWPVGIYPYWLRWTLTFLVPIAYAVTVPAEALSGRQTPATLLGAVALAAVMLAASRGFWKFGVRRYSGASA